LLKQTYPIYELIIVDGSSSEKVSEEIKRICLSRTGDYYDLARAITVFWVEDKVKNIFGSKCKKRC